MTPHSVAMLCWSAFAIVWLVMAFGRNRAVRTENPVGRLLQWTYLGIAYMLLFRTHLDTGALNQRFVPAWPWVAWFGAFLAVVGIGLTIWARIHLGRQWSATVTIRAEHELIATGPYARLRHPIYTGMLTAMLGTALTLGEWRGLLAVLIATIGFSFKAKKEERFLEEEFGPAFEEHRRRTGFLLPRLG